MISSITGAIYQHVALMMSESHTQLFALLVTMERLRMSQQLTNQELALFVNGVDTSEVDDTIVIDGKLDWLSSKVWLDCAAIEMTLPCFRGLRHSLAQYNNQWHEYFQVIVNECLFNLSSKKQIFNKKCILSSKKQILDNKS